MKKSLLLTIVLINTLHLIGMEQRESLDRIARRCCAIEFEYRYGSCVLDCCPCFKITTIIPTSSNTIETIVSRRPACSCGGITLCPCVTLEITKTTPTPR